MLAGRKLGNGHWVGNQQGLPHRYIMSLDPQGNLVGWELSSFFIGEVKLPRSTSYEVKELGFKQRLPAFNHYTKSDESGQRKLLITETCLFQIHSLVSFEFALNLYFSLSVEKALENCYCRVWLRNFEVTVFQFM